MGEERCTLKLADMEGGGRVMAGRPVKEEKRPDTDWLLPCTMREAGALSARCGQNSLSSPPVSLGVMCSLANL